MVLNDLLGIRYEAGWGTGRFPMKRGSFRYIDHVTEKRQLSEQPEIMEENRIVLKLTDNQGRTEGKAEIRRDGRLLRLRLSWENPEFNRFTVTIPVNRNEHYYGCGETFSKFDLAGENVRIWVAEHQNTDRIAKKIVRQTVSGKHPENVRPFREYESYYVQPTVVSSGRYFIHVDSSNYMEFDFRKNGYVTIRMREAAEIIIGQADSFSELSGLLADLLGHQIELPDWCYDGVILGIQQGNDVIDGKLGITADAYHIPVSGVWSQDWCGCRRTKFGYQVMWNWEADASIYPDLKDKIAQWKEKGIHFLGYINPFLALEKDLYRTASAKGYCVKDREGRDYLVTITTFPAAMIDFTNPEAYDWYKNIIKENMIGIGMAGWMADFGEYLPTDAVLYSGEDAEKLHNRWPAIWAKMNREAIQETGKEGEIFFFTRAGFTDTVRYSTMMWNGDQHVDFSMDDGLPSVIPATLSLAMSGFGLAHSDIGGYTTMAGMTRSEELLMRWEEMNAFSPLMRSHEGNQPSRDVQFDENEKTLDQLKRTVDMHVALKDYLKAAVHENAEKGIPVMRPLFYHYDEPRAYKEGYEYLLGRDILVAPVLKEKAVSRQVYFPQDRWVHLLTGREYHGGIAEVEAPIGRPPVFIRKDSAWRDELLEKLKEK